MPATESGEASAPPAATSTVSAGGLTVSARSAVHNAARAALESLVEDRVAPRLTERDSELWGPDAAAEAAVRLDWLRLPRTSRELLPRLSELAANTRDAGLDHVVLSGMGGSSLAPEVIAASRGCELTVLDTTDPQQVHSCLADRLERTVLVVASKSGTTIETDSHRRAYEQAFREAGIDPADRIVAVTDPGSPLAELAQERGYSLVLADPNVGGRYSALSAFGLVPAALAGVDVAALLDEAEALMASLSAPPEENPALILGALLGGWWGHDKLLVTGSASTGLGDWIEQLVAESTGKDGTGLLPVVVPETSVPGVAPAPDAHALRVETAATAGASETTALVDTTVTGPLGAQFLAWEYATAVAGRLLGIDPFNQPNVTESKDNTKALLAAPEDENTGTPASKPHLVAGPVEVYLGDSPASRELAVHEDLPDLLRALLATVPEDGYLAVLAYLDRDVDTRATEIRTLLARGTTRPVTFGWGPRYLHSTGQYHKGGPRSGAFLQITGEAPQDVAIPDRPYTFARLQRAQAQGDLEALTRRDRPTVRLHLRDRAEGVARVVDALRRVAS
ncbi:glucose-6-phosphate isomerase [Lipingzhangella sp. LS1_29]|uniref:Glucose-6-phosphate isomerase n=1 Tax=Lipingzhangella rawalii TaxID=2055835 RepID=A0ABU2H0C0_9ACTN|nr:glucose-6-phosphate isomerase [Lipingzhangella rawalii]MDS1268753.1 glucose-6-phosphate isomerase [Lipingzhangella rawalii]